MVWPRQRAVIRGGNEMNKIAMITGAGSGVGRAVAKALAAQGWSCALVGRKQEALEETAQALKGDHLVAPGRCRRSRAGQSRLRPDQGQVRPPGHAVQQCRHGHARHPDRGAELRAVAGHCRRQPDRRLPLHPGSGADDEGADAAAAAASSTMARSAPTGRGRTARPIPPPSTPSPA